MPTIVEQIWILSLILIFFASITQLCLINSEHATLYVFVNVYFFQSYFSTIKPSKHKLFTTNWRNFGKNIANCDILG